MLSRQDSSGSIPVDLNDSDDQEVDGENEVEITSEVHLPVADSIAGMAAPTVHIREHVVCPEILHLAAKDLPRL